MASLLTRNTGRIMDIVSSMTKYFRASLADESLLGVKPNAADRSQATVSALSIQSGQFSLAEASKLFGMYTKRGGQKDSEPAPEKIEVRVSPFMFRLKQFHGHWPENIPRVLLPLWMTASLSPTGALEPQEGGSSPWLHRELLEPAGSELVISSVSDFDAYVSEHWDESALAGGWPAYFAFGREMLEKLTDRKSVV